MSPSNVVSLTIAIVSAISSLLTIAYVSIKTKFQDKQDANIAIKVGASYNKPAAEIIITLKNDESFSQKITSFKNGKQDKDTKSNLLQIISDEEVINFEDEKELLPSIKSNISHSTKDYKSVKEKINKESKSAPPLNQKFLIDQKNSEASNSLRLTEEKTISSKQDVTNFSENALLANKEGDKLIADNRNNLIKKSLYVFNNIVNILYGDEKLKKVEHMNGPKFSLGVSNFFEDQLDNNPKNKIKFHNPILRKKSSSPEIAKKTFQQEEDTKDKGKEEMIEEIIKMDTLINDDTVVEIEGDSNIYDSSNDN